MNIDDAISERLEQVKTALSTQIDELRKRAALAALGHVIFATTGLRPEPIRGKRESDASRGISGRRCLTIDADGKTCNHPETEQGATCPGFSRDACARYEPDAHCATCGGKPTSGSA